jgi:multisubunit Na+/H+ antiporter MnhB subunit
MTDGFFDLTNPNFVGIIWHLILHIIALTLLIRVVYYGYNRKEKYLFSFFLMGILAFFITSMLLRVTIEMGMGLGLVAVLAILRLRAKNFSVKDMSYTFAVFGLSVLNALNVLNFPYLGVLVINALIILSAWLLEIFVVSHKSETTTITYENLDLLRPEKKQKLLKDVSELTGKEVLKVKIRKIDYQKRVALLDIFCKN